MKNLIKYFLNKEQFKLVKQKGIYPNNWVDSIEKLKCEYLPKKGQFHNKLNGENVTEKVTIMLFWYRIHLNVKLFRNILIYT